MALAPALSAAAQALGLGTGMAGQARDTIQAQKEYQQHVIDAQSNGQTPLSFEEFQKQRKQAPSPAAADLGMGS